jgi:hypothetical protein
MDQVVASADRWLPLVLGAVLLLVGRRLFWLLIATVGFLVAFTLVQRLAPESPQPLHWVLAVGAGLVGALLAIFAQQLAVGAAGMLFGGFATLWVLEHYGIDLGNWEWVALVAGGVVAGVLALAVLETALVVLSAVLGAGLVVGASRLDGLPAVVLFVVLVIVGVSVQIGSQGGKTKRTKKIRASSG